MSHVHEVSRGGAVSRSKRKSLFVFGTQFPYEPTVTSRFANFLHRNAPFKICGSYDKPLYDLSRDEFILFCLSNGFESEKRHAGKKTADYVKKHMPELKDWTPFETAPRDEIGTQAKFYCPTCGTVGSCVIYKPKLSKKKGKYDDCK